jgi:hypothetical protein
MENCERQVRMRKELKIPATLGNGRHKLWSSRPLQLVPKFDVSME